MIKLLIGGSPCFVAGTMIRTMDGIKPIEEIKVGDLVLTHKNNFKPVTEIMKRTAKSTVIVKSENCGEIECTEEHPFYTKTMTRSYDSGSYNKKLSNNFEWLDPVHFKKEQNSSGTIKKQTYLTCVTDNINKIPNYNGVYIKENSYSFRKVQALNIDDPNFWRVIGYWLGNGWYSYKYKNGIKKLSGVKICCGKHKVQAIENMLNSANLHFYKNEERTVYKFNIANLELALFLKKFGKGAKFKHLSPETFFLPSDLAVSFLQGYLDADGHIDGHICTFSTISKELAYGIKYMVNKYYHVSCSIKESQNQNNIIEGRTVNTNNVYNGNFHLCRQKQSHYFVEDSYILSPYKSVIHISNSKTVYNLSVQDDESYTANGLVVHNCTYWSIAQTKNRETQAEGLGWELFKNYLIAKEKFKPDFFLYENNKSMAKAIKAQITEEFGIESMLINSALVSAQNRNRLYWFNWDVEQPEDRGILLKDIIETRGQSLSCNDKSYCLTATYDGATPSNTLERHQRELIAEPVGVGYRNRREGDGKLYRRFETHGEEKSNALTTVRTDSMVAEPVCLKMIRTEEGKRLRKQYESGEIHHGYNEHRIAVPRDDGKTNTLTTVTKDNQIIEPIRVGTMPTSDGRITNSQAYRVYGDDGKSVTLKAEGGGYGAKTGLYAIPEGCKCDSKQPIYRVENGLITIKDKQYPIKLKDGYYIIRKLTPVECERLQTLPDGYTEAVSNTQRYKGLGNGWTAEVIIHILNGALKDVPRDEEIVVLSMYDGIATGRYCLDKMGFTNVKYYAYEIDKFAMKVAMSNYPDIIQCGDAFSLREDDWELDC